MAVVKKTKLFPVLLTIEEHKILKLEALKRDISASNLVRMAVNKYLNPRDSDKSLWKI